MKKETRKEEILKTAAHLFKEKGYSAVTMRDLANAMGIKASSLYNHISSKQAILQEIIIAIAEDFTSGMNAIVGTKANSLQKLEMIITLHVNIAVKNADGLSALNSDWMHLESKLDYYLQLRKDYEDNFKHILELGIRNNEIKPVNSDVIVFTMLSTLRSLYLWIPKKKNLKHDELTMMLTKILLQGVNNN